MFPPSCFAYDPFFFIAQNVAKCNIKIYGEMDFTSILPDLFYLGGFFLQFLKKMGYTVRIERVREKGEITMQIDVILEQVKNGTLSIEAAKNAIGREPYEELGFAKLDVSRPLRQGVAEVVFCSGKEEEHLVEIFRRLYAKEGRVLGTRADSVQYEQLKKEFPELSYDPASHIVKLDQKPLEQKGRIAVCTAGTADFGVAEEAAQTAEFLGNKVDRIYDVGVSGLHRLLAKLPEIQKANCIIAVAGMEGAVASVIGGLVSSPVIAVPTSVGYGANFGGVSALLTMLNSCANGVSVVNIDNGFGAGYSASSINQLVVKKEEKS